MLKFGPSREISQAKAGQSLVEAQAVKVAQLILVTGATGFVGRALLPQLVEGGHEVRCLLRPSKHSPRLPKGVAVQVALASLDDERALRAAMTGVDTVIHLIGAEWTGTASDVLSIDTAGTRIVGRAVSGEAWHRRERPHRAAARVRG